MREQDTDLLATGPVGRDKAHSSQGSLISGPVESNLLVLSSDENAQCGVILRSLAQPFIGACATELRIVASKLTHVKIPDDWTTSLVEDLRRTARNSVPPRPMFSTFHTALKD